MESIRNRHSLWFALGAVVLSLFLIRTAWCAEDAYIGFRVADNFLNGQGLTWNVGERVQVYTDPLFEFLLIAGTAILRSDYWSSMVVSFLLSIGAYAFLMSGRAPLAILLGTTVLLTSKGFMDFSMSGLENPATHFLIAAYVWVYWRKRDPFWLSLIASLAAVNRMDSLLLFLPSLVWLYCLQGSRVIRPMLLGAVPFVSWEAFSLFYYGFPVPNTAFAKLNTGIPQSEVLEHGLHYFQNAAVWDKVTIVAIAVGMLAGLFSKDWPLAAGAILSCAYVVWVGGDYMVSRFLTPALVLCCALLVQHAPRRKAYSLALTAAILLLGMTIPHPTLLTTRNFGMGSSGQVDKLLVEEYLGVVDERLFFYRATGLLRWQPNDWPDFPWRKDGIRLRENGDTYLEVLTAGMTPYYAGPGVYVFDRGSLCDALTARLPMIPGPWRTGHYWRDPPAGYSETLRSGQNRIQNPNLAEYYRHLTKVIRGPLWGSDRFREIIAFNTGRYQRLLK